MNSNNSINDLFKDIYQKDLNMVKCKKCKKKVDSRDLWQGLCRGCSIKQAKQMMEDARARWEMCVDKPREKK